VEKTHRISHRDNAKAGLRPAFVISDLIKGISLQAEGDLNVLLVLKQRLRDQEVFPRCDLDVLITTIE